MRTVPLGLDNIVLPSDITRRKTFEAANQTSHAGGDSSKHRWRVGELEFEALMRRLENAVSCTDVIGLWEYWHPWADERLGYHMPKVQAKRPLVKVRDGRAPQAPSW